MHFFFKSVFPNRKIPRRINAGVQAWRENPKGVGKKNTKITLVIFLPYWDKRCWLFTSFDNSKKRNGGSDDNVQAGSRYGDDSLDMRAPIYSSYPARKNHPWFFPPNNFFFAKKNCPHFSLKKMQKKTGDGRPFFSICTSGFHRESEISRIEYNHKREGRLSQIEREQSLAQRCLVSGHIHRKQTNKNGKKRNEKK